MKTLNYFVKRSFNNTFYKVLLFSILMCISPSNILAYTAPLTLLIILSLVTRSNKIMINFGMLTIAWLFLGVFYKYYYLDEYYYGNGLLAFITYSTFLPVIAIPSKYLRDQTIFFKISKTLLVIVLLESFIGLTQSFYGFNQIGTFDLNAGDYIEGTIHLPLESERSLSNPIFSIIMSSILIFLIGHYRITKLGKYTIIFGLIILLMATTMHVIIFLLITYLLTAIFLKPSKISFKNKLFGAVIILGIIMSISTILPSNFGSILGHGKILLENKYPKTAVMFNYYSKITKNDVIMKTFGLGPGQFLSRASFISTGKYFGTNSSGVNKMEIPFTGMTPSFKKGVDSYWMSSINEAGFGSSSTSKPQSSWNAFITEFGIMSSVIFLIIFITFLFKIRGKIKNNFDYNIAFSLTWCLLFMFLLGFQENYWEVPQAIFIGFMLIKISYSILIYNKNYNNVY